MSVRQSRQWFRRLLALSDICLVLFVVLGASLLAGLATTRLFPEADLIVLLFLQGTLILGGMVAIMVWRRLHPLGIRMRWPVPVDLLRGLGALFLFILVNLMFAAVVNQVNPELLEDHHDHLGGFGADLVAEMSISMVALAMLFVALYEELVARGLLLARSEALLGGIWGPVLLSSILFGLGHFYQGWVGVIQTTLAGIVLARLTIYWGTLWPAIIAHGLLNTLSLLLLGFLR